jgi:hypothetical protein
MYVYCTRLRLVRKHGRKPKLQVKEIINIREEFYEDTCRYKSGYVMSDRGLLSLVKKGTAPALDHHAVI